MPRALWWLLACSPTATAVLMTTATRAATTNDWRAVPEMLKRREVSAVFVEDAASLIDVNWSTALEGSAEVVVECDCCVEDVASTLTEAFWPDDASYASKAAPVLVQLARRFDECLGAASDGGRVRVRATCLLYTSPSPRDRTRSRMPSSA